MRGYSTVNVEVSHDDVMDDIDDATLIAELRRRGKEAPGSEIEDALRALYRGRPQEAVIILERLLLPRREPPLLAYEKATLARDPVSGHLLIQ